MTLPTVFATLPGGNTPASLLDTNLSVLEQGIVQPVTATGAVNSYTLAPLDPWVTGYSLYKGNALTVIFGISNTGATSVNVSGLGNASVVKNIGGTATALVAGDIYANVPYLLTCDGTSFWLTNVTTSAGSPFLHTQVFGAGTSSFTPAAGVSRVYVEGWGAGGGGGGANGSTSGGGGGGSGGYFAGYIDVTPGVASVVTVGTGGGGGTNTGGNGVSGGSTSFAGATATPLANGGTGGTGSTSSNNNVPGGAGGTSAVAGFFNIPGQTGMSTISSSTSSGFKGGAGGSAPRGGPGAPPIQSFNTAVAGAGGVSPGGGGSGGFGASTIGGSGGDGMLIAYYP